MDRDIPCSWIQFGSTGGFHVTQVSLIITQVKNKIALPCNKLSQEIEIS